MKKVIYTTMVFTVMLVLLGCTPNRESDLTLMGLEGDIHTIEQRFVEKSGYIGGPIYYNHKLMGHNMDLVYDESGYLIENKFYISGELIAEGYTTYDDKGYPLEYIYETLDGQKVQIVTYDSKGDSARIKSDVLKGTGSSKTAEGRTTFTTELTYDKGYPVSTSFDYGDVTSIDHYIFEDKIIKAIETIINDTIIAVDFQTDGNLTSGYDMINYGTESRYQFEYEFNEHGDWIKMHVTKDGEEVGYMSRTYTYYE